MRARKNKDKTLYPVETTQRRSFVANMCFISNLGHNVRVASACPDPLQGRRSLGEFPAEGKVVCGPQPGRLLVLVAAETGFGGRGVWVRRRADLRVFFRNQEGRT